MSDKNEKQALPNLVQDEIMNVKSSVLGMEMLASKLREVGLDRSADIIEKECGLINASLCNISNIVNKNFDDWLKQVDETSGLILKAALAMADRSAAGEKTTMGEKATDSMGKAKP